MALTTIPSELSSVSGISDSSSSTAITIDSSQNVTFAGNITTGSNTISGVLASAATATTQAASDNSTKLATTAYVTTALANLVDSAPGTLNTLNELAAALGDDANFSTTVTNSIATKLPLAGGTLTGALVGTNASFSTASTTDYVLRLTDNGVADYDVIFPDTSTYQLTTNTSSDKTFKLLNSGSGTFNLSVEGNASLTGSGNTAVLINTGNNSGDNSQIKFGDSADDDVGQINYDHQNNKFQFRTNGGANSFELESNGNPVFKGTNHTNLQVKSGDDSVVAFLQTVQGTDARFGTSTNHPVNFAQNGSFRLTLDTNGNTAISGLLGVNKAVNTAVALSVGSDATTTSSYGFEVTNSSANTRFLVDGVGSSFFYKSDNALGMKFDASSGNLGIGPATALTALDILRDSDHQVFLRSVTGNNQVRKGGIAGINYSGNQLAMLHYYSDSGTNYQSYGAPLGGSGYRGPTQHRFYVASGPDGTTHYEKMRLDTGGLILGSANVGGTTSGDLELINDTGGTVVFRRNEGAISNGEVIGQHYYTGDDPSATKTAHIDRVSAISNWSANNYPVKRSFWFDQGGNLLQSWYVYRATDGNVISEHIAGTNASASMRLSNDAITWQVDCRTDDHFAIYNQTAAQTRFFINTNGRTKFGSGDVTGTAIDTSGTVNGTSNAWSWSTKVTAGSGNVYCNLQHFTAQNPNNTTSLFQAGVSTAGTKYAVYSNGGLANFQSNNSNLCDEREKKNIEATSSQWALVKGFDIKQFHYNDENDSDAKRLGVIAQEVEVNSPELITEWTKQLPQDEELWEEGDDLPEGVSVGDIKQAAVEKVSRKGVKEQQVMWMAIKALQEAQTRIEALEAEVAALKGE